MIRSRWKFWLGLQHWCISSVFQPVSSVHLPQGTSQFLHLSDLYPLQQPLNPFNFQWPITESHQSLGHNIDCSCSMRATSLSRPEIRSGCCSDLRWLQWLFNPFWSTSSSTSKTISKTPTKTKPQCLPASFAHRPAPLNLSPFSNR